MNKVTITTNIFASRKAFFSLWCAYFLFALIAGFVFYTFLIPNILSLHAPGSPLSLDSTYFNDVAIKLVNAMQESGWSAWKLVPSTAAAGQSSFLAIIYFYFGVNPLFAIPFNALFHSFSAILIYLIAIELLKDNRFSGRIALASSLCYLGFPSELFLVAQIHKDIYVAFGFFLALWSILKIFLHQDNTLGLLKLLIISVLAVLVIASMKPYLLQILGMTVLLILIFQLARIFPFSIRKFSFLAAYLAIILSAFFYLINEHPSPNANLDNKSGLNVNADSNPNPNPNVPWFSGESFITPGFDWKKSDFLPEFVDRKFMALAAARSSLISSGVSINAKSMIDVDNIPSSFEEVLRYVPRALQVALLAPFPDSWFYEDSIVKIVSSIEMLFLYLSFMGLIFLIGKQFKYTFLLCFVFAAVPLITFGISSPNIGTLYRIRYPFEMIVLMLAMCGWAQIFDRYRDNFKKSS